MNLNWLRSMTVVLVMVIFGVHSGNFVTEHQAKSNLSLDFAKMDLTGNTFNDTIDELSSYLIEVNATQCAVPCYGMDDRPKKINLSLILLVMFGIAVVVIMIMVLWFLFCPNWRIGGVQKNSKIEDNSLSKSEPNSIEDGDDSPETTSSRASMISAYTH